MPDDQKAPAETKKTAPITLKEFFETVPPGRYVNVTGIAEFKQGSFGTAYYLRQETLQLHCVVPACDGVRFFDAVHERYLDKGSSTLVFATYRCRNCHIATKTYACDVKLSGDGKNGELFKFGEFLPFGPPTRARVITLLGPERDYFLKGRRVEQQGLGIAAFAYYRRAVENQKNRILDEIIKVSEKLGVSTEMLADLNAAKKETQFSKAIEAVKHGIPPALLINGHNPLTLLHSALSEGLHAQTDEQCLELATSIRVVLTELADRLGAALKEEAELNAAVTRLLRKDASK